MDENTDEGSNLIESLAQVLDNTSETLQQFQNTSIAPASTVSQESPTELQNVLPASTVSNEQPEQETVETFTVGNAPIKTQDNDPNYQLWQKAAEEGNKTALINTALTPENIESATKLLLQNSEFKDYIGQYALSNDVTKNLEAIQQGIIKQKNYSLSTDDLGEVDGKTFTGGESYFLNEILNKISNSDAIDSFFSQLRDEINTEVIAKIEKKEEENKQPSIEPQEPEDDAFTKTKKLFNEREGELVEDLTRDETWDELRRMLSSPEYRRFQTEDIGYDSNKGHPDPEIRAYEAEMNKWRKQLPHPEFEKPEKPKNYEERRSQPKIDYDRRRKEGMSFEEAIEAGYKQYELKTIEPQTNKSIQPESSNTVVPKAETTSESFKQSITPQDNNLTSFSYQDSSDKNSNVYSYIPEPTTSFEQTSMGLETTSELPTKEMLVNLDGLQDKNSEQILSNTEKTNMTLEGLTQMLAILIQSGGMQAPGAGQPTPVPVPTSTNNAQPGIPDIVLASKDTMIPSIRSKFIYSV